MFTDKHLCVSHEFCLDSEACIKAEALLLFKKRLYNKGVWLMSAEKFQVEQEELEKTIQLHISGELDLAAAQTFRHALESVVHREDKALVLNLSELRYIDSTGIGLVVSALKIRDELKMPLAVRNIPAAIRRLFDLTGISGFLNEGIEGSA